MTEATSPYDWVGRYGGEEFLIVVVDCDTQRTFDLAERVRHAINATPMAVPHALRKVTSSFGVSATTPGEILISKT